MEEENNFLRQVPIFSDLDENTIEQIAKLGSRKTFNKDIPVLLEHDTGSALFVIVKGKVKVTRQSEDGREVIITLLNESDFFGEMSILDGFSHSANVIAMEESELFIIQHHCFLFQPGNRFNTRQRINIC